MNKIISIIALLLILPIFKVEAYDFVIDEITYNFTKEHGTVEVSGLREFLNLEPGDRNSSLPLVVNIPPVVTYKDNKYDVVSIGYAAFQGCRKVTEIKIPSTVREIGEFAFENCSKLEIINIPDSVKMIGRCTFSGCYALKSILLPLMLKSIGVEAFKGCDFKEITIPEGVTVIGDEAFATCESLEYVSLPDSMETLHNGLFSGCGKLKSIKLPRNLKIIRDYCFAECILLENMEFPNSLYYLGDFALSKTGVKNIIIPDSFTELGKSVFYGCTDLESISIQNNKLRIGGSLFAFCI